MACLIKPHTDISKGVITFTTQERDRLIFEFEDIRSLVIKLKQRYVIGLHHNWHDYSLKYDDLFDFHLAGEEDLREIAGRDVPLLPMDACNFSPECFQLGNDDKFWDILFVARAVEFKGIPEFFTAIQRIYNSGKKLRVLFICPLPPQDGYGSMRNIRCMYDAMFSDTDQDMFTLLTTDFRYPFPFDLPTLSTFYRSSRVFVHSAPDERRCRVAAYAWSCGMPVVGMSPVGSILSAKLRRSPYFYEIQSYDEFPEKILEALEISKTQSDFSEVRAEVSSSQSINLFEAHLQRIFSGMDIKPPSNWGWPHSLDIRLGRHHGLPAGNNQLQQDIATLLEFLIASSPSSLEALRGNLDPEAEIARRCPSVPRLSRRRLTSHTMLQMLKYIKYQVRNRFTGGKY